MFCYWLFLTPQRNLVKGTLTPQTKISPIAKFDTLITMVCSVFPNSAYFWLKSRACFEGVHKGCIFWEPGGPRAFQGGPSAFQWGPLALQGIARVTSNEFYIGSKRLQQTVWHFTKSNHVVLQPKSVGVPYRTSFSLQESLSFCSKLLLWLYNLHYNLAGTPVI